MIDVSSNNHNVSISVCECPKFTENGLRKTKLHMKDNLGSLNRIIRLSIAIIILALYFTHDTSRGLTLVSLFIANLFIVTSFYGYCPLYFLLGVSGNSDQKPEKGFVNRIKNIFN